MTPLGRSQEEMQLTLARLAGEFNVDTTPAQGLAGAELAAWLDAAEDKVFYRELAELQRQREGLSHARTQGRPAQKKGR